MNHLLFSGKVKLADVILADYRLLNVLPRFGISLGFGEKSVEEVCRRHEVPLNLFLLICNVHTFDDYLPAEEELKSFRVEDLIAFLRKSHNYYIGERIPDLQAKLIQMIGCCEGKYARSFERFFRDYRQEVVNHFDYEESVVFPYIDGLLHSGNTGAYHIEQFEENHTNIQEKLNDLKNIIIKYLPGNCPSLQQNEILFDLFLLEDDLNKHTLLEDKILVPLVLQLEKQA